MSAQKIFTKKFARDFLARTALARGLDSVGVAAAAASNTCKSSAIVAKLKLGFREDLIYIMPVMKITYSAA
jgi:hypothetical protein